MTVLTVAPRYRSPVDAPARRYREALEVLVVVMCGRLVEHVARALHVVQDGSPQRDAR
jgi:hypothetical protein